MIYVGTTGSFVPVKNGGTLYRVKDGQKYHVTGTKGFQWIERDVAKHRTSLGELEIDMSYFDKLVEDALKAINKFVPYEELIL